MPRADQKQSIYLHYWLACDNGELMNNDTNPFDRIDELVKKYASEMERHVSSYMKAHPGSNETVAKDIFFLQKIATLVVGIEIQRKEIVQFTRGNDDK